MSNVISYQVGRAKITKIPEMAIPEIPGASLFPQWNTEEADTALAGLSEEFFSPDGSQLAISTHSWLIETGTHTVLIDTASGNGKSRPSNPGFHQLDTRWFDNLRAAGVEAEKVDFVLLSHLHVDHVGWCTHLENGEWVPTFPNARYLFSAAEYEFYSNPDNVQDPSKGIFADSIDPVVAAGLDTRLAASEASPIPGFQLIRTPGHSHDHYSISFTSAGDQAFFWGDVMHHPVQIRKPEWSSVFCEAPEMATASRKQAMNHALAHQALIFTTHFAGSSVGRIQQDASGLTWLPQ
ncbi:MBL fold metallo-hydrolase [Rouxiella sp. T17]|uniref:MBL fold metallo-hydrolase n=1 Tax=Rouxiella sp. T17 TaxID=3085684 RepID=UPI002FC6B190